MNAMCDVYYLNRKGKTISHESAQVYSRNGVVKIWAEKAPADPYRIRIVNGDTEFYIGAQKVLIYMQDILPTTKC